MPIVSPPSNSKVVCGLPRLVMLAKFKQTKRTIWYMVLCEIFMLEYDLIANLKSYSRHQIPSISMNGPKSKVTYNNLFSRSKASLLLNLSA